MRKASACVAFLIAVAAAWTPSALAAPVVQATAKIVPIKGFPGTGNILGAGAALQVNATATRHGIGRWRGFPAAQGRRLPAEGRNGRQ